uniref:Methyltransferase domain-containing protein n=1 Tax=Caenorhabditis japonica TaxID=281687 RepID=A0A8R1DFU1_CAEJA
MKLLLQVSLFAFAILLPLVLLFKLFYPDTGVLNDEFLKLVQEQHFKNEPFKSLRSAIECPDPTDKSTCLYIIDRIGYHTNGSWFVARFITAEPSLDRGTLSISKLLKPNVQSQSTIDTAKWQVDVSTLDPLIPNGMQFASLFNSGHFPLNTNFTGQFHFIGVATGGFMSYVAHYFKNLNLTGVDIDPHSEQLAKKWFGYTDNNRSKIVVEDGAKYIKAMAKRGETSDAVLIDACYNHEPDHGVFCPVDALKTPEFFENLSKVVGPRGITAFNLFDVNGTPEKYKAFQDSVLEHFGHCKLLDKLEMVRNAFLLCANYDILTNTVDQDEVQDFLTELRLENILVSA